MSTRGHVGYRKEDGSIRATYNHFDSYPRELGINTGAYIKEKGIDRFCKLIDCACVYGGFRAFPEHYDEDEDFTVTDRKNLNEDYAYIYDSKTGELVEFYKWGKLQKRE